MKREREREMVIAMKGANEERGNPQEINRMIVHESFQNRTTF